VTLVHKFDVSITATGLALCDVTPHSLVDRYERFRGTCGMLNRNLLHPNTGTLAPNGTAPHLRRRFSHLIGKLGAVNKHPYANHINMPAATTCLKTEAAGLCDIQVRAYQTTRYHIPEHNHLCLSVRIIGMCLALAVLENGNLLEPLFISTSFSVSHFIQQYSITMALPSFNFSKIISVFTRT